MAGHTHPYIKWPVSWEELDGVAGLTPSGKLLLLAIVMHCQVHRTGGWLTEGQLSAVARSVYRGTAALSQLVDAGLIVRDKSRGPYLSRNQVSEQSEESSMQVRDTFGTRSEHFITRWRVFHDKFWFVARGDDTGVLPAQTPDSESPRARVGARRRAGEKERKREEHRPPSADRRSSARDAPRAGGAAARHAPEPPPGPGDGDLEKPGGRVGGSDDDGPAMTKEKALEMMRELIKKSGRYSGRDAKLRKFPVELYEPPPQQPPDDSGYVPSQSNGHRK